MALYRSTVREREFRLYCGAEIANLKR